MRFQIVRTRPGFGAEERLHVYADKHNADLWLTDQGAVADPQGNTVLVAAENGVVWQYHVEEIADAEESPATEPAPKTKPRARRPRRAATPRARMAVAKPSRS